MTAAPRTGPGRWILPLLAFLMARSHRKRLQAARRFADAGMVDRLMPPAGGARGTAAGKQGARPRAGAQNDLRRRR